MSELVLHIPHSSRRVPKLAREKFCIDDSELEREVLLMTDHFTDELFAPPESPRSTEAVIFPVSRLVVDPERFENDADEPMAAVGMGVIYTLRADGTPLRKNAPCEAERRALLETYYRPHHAALESKVNKSIEERGLCLVVDCHSFPSEPLPYELDQNPERPDICLGTDEFHTPESLLGVAREAFEMQGLRVAVNQPFSGALVPLKYYRKDQRVLALMIEVNRRLYMNEASAVRSDRFELMKRILAHCLNRIAEAGSELEAIERHSRSDYEWPMK